MSSELSTVLSSLYISVVLLLTYVVNLFTFSIKDERHFLRDPPAGVDFHFDLDATMPIALTILAEDENLQKMRFNLVPKK